MLRLFVTFCLLGLSVCLHAQHPTLRDSLIDQLARRNYVTGSRIVTGLYDGPLIVDPQYDDFEHLLPLLKENDVVEMFRHDSLAVAAFAFKAAVKQFPELVSPLLCEETEYTRRDSFPNFLSACQGTIHTTLIDFMMVEIWVSKYTREVVLTREGKHCRDKAMARRRNEIPPRVGELDGF